MTAPMMSAPVTSRLARRPTMPMMGGGSPVDKFAKYGQDATTAYATEAGDDLKKSVGGLLGNLNSIGALRSGGVTAGVNDIATTFSRNVGAEAGKNALAAASIGQQEGASLRADTAATADRTQQADQFGKRLAFDTTGQQIQKDQFGATLANQKDEFGRSLAETTAGRVQAGDIAREGFGVARRGQDISHDEFGVAQGNALRMQQLGINSNELIHSQDWAQRGDQFDKTLANNQDQFGQNLGWQKDQFGQQLGFQRDQFGEQQREYNTDRQDRLQAEKNKKKSGFWNTIGGIAGGVLGKIL